MPKVERAPHSLQSPCNQRGKGSPAASAHRTGADGRGSAWIRERSFIGVGESSRTPGWTWPNAVSADFCADAPRRPGTRRLQAGAAGDPLVVTVATRGTASNYLQRGPSPSGLADVLDLILDKGLVIDAYV